MAQLKGEFDVVTMASTYLDVAEMWIETDELDLAEEHVVEPLLNVDTALGDEVGHS